MSFTTRRYNPETDTFNEDSSAVVPISPGPAPSWVRQNALLAAIEAAKLGLAHDIYATADKYARWLAGGEVDLRPLLSFQERLRDLVDECRRSGEVDEDKVIHDMQVVMGIEPVSVREIKGWTMGEPDAPPRAVHTNIKDTP